MTRTKARIEILRLVNTVGTAALGQRDHEAREMVHLVEQYVYGLGIVHVDSQAALGKVHRAKATLDRRLNHGGTLSESAQAARLLAEAAVSWSGGHFELTDLLGSVQRLADSALERRARFGGKGAKAISALFDR